MFVSSSIFSSNFFVFYFLHINRFLIFFQVLYQEFAFSFDLPFNKLLFNSLTAFCFFFYFSSHFFTIFSISDFWSRFILELSAIIILPFEVFFLLNRMLFLRLKLISLSDSYLFYLKVLICLKFDFLPLASIYINRLNINNQIK